MLSEKNRKPYVILNSAMTLDGKMATKTGSSEISGKEDLLRVHELRREVDAIMVGINTVMTDDPKLTVHKIRADKKDNPIRVVVDSRARTPLFSRILNSDASTIIAVTDAASPERVEKLNEVAEVMVCGKNRVDLDLLMEKLASLGVKTLMLEGGSTLNYSMLIGGLVSEMRVCIAPMIAGGKDAKTLADGDGVDYMKDAVKLKLKKSYKLGEDLIVEYLVISQ
ncbi:MAG TPA: 2,5-diamino-6-(ribosylamino)-4(3H)-pyrimidinone 5'-phosphate reductase [Methanobacterium sp.]|jgi:2,5-diamino-6-(ribosylamino)-4(3H)-pyrimidinone 5'-phosphate reductase|nr:2,5-diamino-6-(ribosylamino)-4(3H)-pyrimidinone 5'-phosphate reductase [Methanobacterium sp.]